MAILDLDTRSDNGRATVSLRGELDISSAPTLADALQRIEADSPPVILVDLRGLEFMDSTGLRTLVNADQRARDAGRRLAIVRGPEAVDRVFNVTRLDERLDLVDDPASA